MTMINLQIKIERDLMNRNVHAIMLNRDIPKLQFVGNDYDGSYVHIFRVYNRHKTEFFNVFAYSRELESPCYSVRFSRVFKAA